MRKRWVITGTVACVVMLCLAWGLREAQSGDAKEEKAKAKAEVKEEKKTALGVKSSLKEAAKAEAKAKAKADAEKARKKDILSETVEVKQLTGEVVSKTPNVDPKFIGIAPKGGDTEHHFAIAEDVQIVGKKSLAQIARGDTVTIVYEETKTKKKDGKERSKRVATTITFETAASEGVLKSGKK